METLLSQVQKEADANSELILQKLLERITNPPIAKTKNYCKKHHELLPIYETISNLRTKVTSAQINNLPYMAAGLKVNPNYFEKTYQVTKEAYNNAECSCLKDSDIGARHICISCHQMLKVVNGCRNPIHLHFKKTLSTEEQVILPQERKSLKSKI